MLLKDIYSESFYENFTEILADSIIGFNKEAFMNQIFDEFWEHKESKQRMKHTSLILHSHFPPDFEQTTKLIETIIAKLREKNITGLSLEFMFFPDYIETYGIDHYDASVKSIELVTQFTSCEFAVRPFVIKYGQKMIEKMHEWSLHEDHRVRRLASEGSRPRLPWAMALPELKKNPNAILPILENLKNDQSEFVRRSVANNLNDIAKDNPKVVLQIAKQWKGQSKETDAIIKHGCRTLLKQGNTEILAYFGFADDSDIIVTDFKIVTPTVQIGDHLAFAFALTNAGSKPQTVRIEYGLHYLRQNGQHSKKVFKISERVLSPGENSIITRRQSFKIITTRRFYAGLQQLSIIINGQQKVMDQFELTDGRINSGF